MKFVWEPFDIRCGLCVVRSGTRPKAGDIPPEHYIIGYQASRSDGVFLISLRDGAVMRRMHVGEMVEHLNAEGFVPCAVKRMFPDPNSMELTKMKQRGLLTRRPVEPWLEALQKNYDSEMECVATGSSKKKKKTGKKTGKKSKK